MDGFQSDSSSNLSFAKCCDELEVVWTWATEVELPVVNYYIGGSQSQIGTFCVFADYHLAPWTFIFLSVKCTCKLHNNTLLIL